MADYDRPVIIAAEGETERDFVQALAEIHKWLDVVPFSFSDNRNWNTPADPGPHRKLRCWLEGFKFYRRAQVQVIGIIADAETSHAQSWNEIVQDLNLSGLPCPTRPKEIWPGNPVASAILIMPDGRKDGCFEDALLDACIDAKHLTCAEDFLKCIGNPGRTDAWESKVKTHAVWKAHLASVAGKKPHHSLRESFSRTRNAERVWNLEHQSIRIVRDFIETLRAYAPPLAVGPPQTLQ